MSNVFHYFLVFLFLCCANVFAQGAEQVAKLSVAPVLNEVTLQLSAEQWLSTTTALVQVSVQATVPEQGLDKLQQTILSQLKTLSPQGEWHIVTIERQAGQAGLEELHLVAQARLPQAALGNLRARAKWLSKPGEMMTLNSIQFMPSEEEQRQVNIALRLKLYQQAQAEIETLNKLSPGTHYLLHKIVFQNSELPVFTPFLLNKLATSNEMAPARSSSPVTSPSESAMPLALPVSKQVSLQATVVLAAVMPNSLR